METTPASRIEINDLLDGLPLSRLQVRVIVLCTLAVLFDGYDMQLMALTVPALAGQWGVPAVAFTVALSSSILGMGLGAAMLAPLGDRFGRRMVLVASLVVVAAGSFGCATAGNTAELVIWRFLTGVGLGGSMPNAFALTADYMPRARRATLLIAMYCNTATGALLASLISPWLINRFGWQGPFLVGGVLPLGAALLLLVAAPESLKFLLHRRPGHLSIRMLLARVAPDVDPELVYARPPPVATAGTLRDLLTPLYRQRTLWLWLGFGMNAFILYLVVSWLPTLLVGAGWTRTQALQAVAFNQVGGILGGLSLAWLMDRLGAERTLVASFLLCAVVLIGFQVAPQGFWTWGFLLLLVGACIGGAQFAIPTLTAAYYPAPILATGTGWASAIARGGAFVAPLTGGALLAQGMTTSRVLSLLALPALIAAAALFVLARLSHRP
jgi:MFS transporter, AAHS family, 4-hydroxybenzoate transporter